MRAVTRKIGPGVITLPSMSHIFSRSPAPVLRRELSQRRLESERMSFVWPTTRFELCLKHSGSQIRLQDSPGRHKSGYHKGQLENAHEQPTSEANFQDTGLSQRVDD